MGNCYSIDHIAEDHIHTDITCNIEEPQQKYRLGTVSNRLLRGLKNSIWMLCVRLVCWLVGCFGLNGPLRQYFSLYRAVSQREGERKEK